MENYKAGGEKGNSNLFATNRLFKKSPLFRKRKKKAPGVYDPKAKYRFDKGGALLTKKVTCKKCGWEWDAADGGNDITTCHKCGGKGLIHAQNGGEPCPEGFQKHPVTGECVNSKKFLKEEQNRKYKQALIDEPKYFDEGIQFVNDWHNSPMYNQMVLNSYEGNQKNADVLTKFRKQNIASMPELNIINSETTKYGTEAPSAWSNSGSYSDTGQIDVFPSGFGLGTSMYVHEGLHSSDKPLGASTPSWMKYKDPRFPRDEEKVFNRAMPILDQKYITQNRAANYKDAEGYNLILKNNPSFKMPTDEEIKQAVISDNILPDDPKFKTSFDNLKNYYKNNIKEYNDAYKNSWQTQGHNYISIPTEVRARLGEIRYMAKKKGIYNPFTEKLTPEKFQEYIKNKDMPMMTPIEDLRLEFTDEEILFMLNNISKNKNKKEEEGAEGVMKYGGLHKFLGGGPTDCGEGYIWNEELQECVEDTSKYNEKSYAKHLAEKKIYEDALKEIEVGTAEYAILEEAYNAKVKELEKEKARVLKVRGNVIPASKALDEADDLILKNGAGPLYQNFIYARNPKELELARKALPQEIKNVLPNQGLYNVAKWDTKNNNWNKGLHPGRELYCTPYGCFAYQKAGASDVPIIGGNIDFANRAATGDFVFEKINPNERQPGDMALMVEMAPNDYSDPDSGMSRRPHHTTIYAEPDPKFPKDTEAGNFYNAVDGNRLFFDKSFLVTERKPGDRFDYYRYVGAQNKINDEILDLAKQKEEFNAKQEQRKNNAALPSIPTLKPNLITQNNTATLQYPKKEETLKTKNKKLFKKKSFKYGGLNKFEEEEGMILDLSQEEIKQYTEGGYIIEELDEYAAGGKSSSCPEGMVWSKKDNKCIKLLNFNSNTLTNIKNRLNSTTGIPLTTLSDGLKIKPLNSFSDFGKEKPMPIRKDSFLETLETDINDFLEKPLERAANIAHNLAEKGEDPSDPLRHSTAGALTAQTIANKTGNIPFISNPLGFLGSNIAGIGHELSTLTNLDDTRPWSVKLQESLEDIYNNSVGANTIFSNKSEKDKVNYLLNLTRTNQLPDGYGEERPFKDNPKWTDPYNQKKEGGASEQKIIFSSKGGDCLKDEYWNGTKCVKIPKNTRIVYHTDKDIYDKAFAAESDSSNFYNNAKSDFNKINVLDRMANSIAGLNPSVQDKRRNAYFKERDRQEKKWHTDNYEPGTTINHKYKGPKSNLKIKPVGLEIDSDGYAFPKFKKPVIHNVYEEPIKEEEFIPMPVKVPDLIDTTTGDIIGQSEQLLAPEYSPSYPENRIGYDKYNRYTTKSGLNKRQPNTGGFYKKASKKVEDIKNYMEGYEDEEGNYIPGEIENAKREGRQLVFKGNSSVADKKAQEAYSQEYDDYENLKNYQNQIMNLMQYKLNKKQFGGLNKFIKGGEPCPEGYVPYNGRCIEWQEPTVIETDEHTGYNAGTNEINQDTRPGSIENNGWWTEHEKFHHLQNLAGDMSTAGFLGQRPNNTVASGQAMEGYYNRRKTDLEAQTDAMIKADPNLQFIPRNKLQESTEGFVGANDLIYSKPGVEGDARRYETYIRNNGESIFPQKKQGGALNKFVGGGSTDCPKDHVWDSNTKKCVKVYTLANDQKFIDGVSNWAMHSSNPDKVTSESNDQIKHYLYSGKYGYDPVSGTLYPLKKEQKTVADAETKKILAKQDDKAAYTQSIIDAGFNPETFGKSKGTNVITGEEIYGDKSQEDVDKINKEAVNNFVTEGHKKAVLESPFNLAAYVHPAGMAAGVIQGGAALLPDIYNFGKDPSWSGAGAIGMDALMMLPAAKGIGKFLGYVPKKLPSSPNAVSTPKSEINWGTWNPKTAEQKDLMNAYAEIERGTKAKGNWMKNVDGTPFQGTPEQFVQQKSSWFKKSFPDYYGETLTTRSPNKFDIFDESKFGATDDGWFGKGIYTHPTIDNAGRAYGDNAYELYVNSANKGIAEGPYGGGAYMYKKDIDLVKKNFYDKYYKIKNSGKWDANVQKEFDSEYESLMGYIKAAEKNNINQYTTLNNHVGVANEIVIPFDNPVKSAKGNIGYFDLKNPIIYEKNGGSISQTKYSGLHRFIGGGQPCPQGFQEDPVTGECVSIMGQTERVQRIEEVPTNQYSRYIANYEEANPRDAYVYQKKADYLKKYKGLNRQAGLSQDNFNTDVEGNFNRNWEYDRNTAVIEQYAKDHGINPKNHVELVEKLADKGAVSYDMIANSKYGSKLQPSLWARSLAGGQELANFIVKQLPGEQGDVFNIQTPGLTKKEWKDIHDSNFGALQTYSAIDIPGAVIGNSIADLSTASGGNYQESPGILSGELKSNMDPLKATLLNPFNYSALAKGLFGVQQGIQKIGKILAKEKSLPGSPNAFDYSKYLTQEEAVAARAQRLISQKNKPGWNEQLTPELEQKLSTAVERHNPASDLPGEKLGTNRHRTSTEVSKNANSKGIPLTDANKARVAAHETGHYYSNSPEEGAEWLSNFNLSKLINKTRKYLRGNSRFDNYANEIRERAAQLKDYIAQKNGIPLDQDFKITQVQLDDAIKNYVKDTGLDNTMLKMLGALKNKKGFLKTMNKYALGIAPYVVPATIIGSSQIPQNKYGGLNKFEESGAIEKNMSKLEIKKLIAQGYVIEEI